MTEHGTALDPGARIEELQIEKELGVGGFGITYLARDLHLDVRVAVKEYLPDRARRRMRTTTSGVWSGFWKRSGCWRG